MAQRQERHTFASLHWYREAVGFLFTFAAITSEVLLGAGLTVSTVNFLTDGKIMSDNTFLANAWAWAQALAIDSGLGITFASVFISIKQRDWIKVCCYWLLTVILALVAGAITDIDTLSHALHITTANAISQVGLNVKVLTICRSIAVVGFVLMSRLKEISFKDLYEAAPSPSQEAETPEETERTTTLVRQLVTEALAEQSKMLFLEAQETLPLSIPQAKDTTPQQQAETAMAQSEEEEQANHDGQQDESTQEKATRLERAYQELVAEGKRISGRALAVRAHVRRSTCNQWLETYHPEVIEREE